MRFLAVIVALLLAVFLAMVGWRRWKGNQPQRQSEPVTITAVIVLFLLFGAGAALARPSPYPPVTPFIGDRYGSAQLGPEVARSVRCPPPACQRAGKARYLYPTRKRPPSARQRWHHVPIPAPRPLAEPGAVEPLSVAQGAWREAARIIGGRPAGCPSRFCGCGASIHLFGRIIPALNLAANWLRFPRAAPAADMVAARRGHVFVLKQHISGNTWLVFDANSGRGRTRIHPRSIAGYAIVDPRGRG